MYASFVTGGERLSNGGKMEDVSLRESHMDTG